MMRPSAAQPRLFGTTDPRVSPPRRPLPQLAPWAEQPGQAPRPHSAQQPGGGLGAPSRPAPPPGALLRPALVGSALGRYDQQAHDSPPLGGPLHRSQQSPNQRLQQHRQQLPQQQLPQQQVPQQQLPQQLPHQQLPQQQPPHQQPQQQPHQQQQQHLQQRPHGLRPPPRREPHLQQHGQRQQHGPPCPQPYSQQCSQHPPQPYNSWGPQAGWCPQSSDGNSTPATPAQPDFGSPHGGPAQQAGAAPDSPAVGDSQRAHTSWTPSRRNHALGTSFDPRRTASAATQTSASQRTSASGKEEPPPPASARWEGRGSAGQAPSTAPRPATSPPATPPLAPRQSASPPATPLVPPTPPEPAAVAPPPLPPAAPVISTPPAPPPQPAPCLHATAPPPASPTALPAGLQGGPVWAQQDYLVAAATSALEVSDVPDPDRRLQLVESYSFATGPRVADEMRELAERLMRWYRQKPGTVVDEMAENLRAPDGCAPKQVLSVLADAVASRPGTAEAHPDLCPVEMLVLRSYTQKPSDIDRDVGWHDAPPPRRRGEPRQYHRSRQRYEDRFNSWDWEKEKAGVLQRNGSIFGPVCKAMRVQGKTPASLDTIQKWIKWICTIAAVTCGEADGQPADLWRGLGGGGIPVSVVEQHRRMQPGDLLAWPAKSSASFDQAASEEYMLGTGANSSCRLSADCPGSILFRIRDVNLGRSLDSLSQYPAEAEHLLGPLTMFELQSIAEDGSNPFGHGLQISMRCLGPLGKALSETPDLAVFLDEVRRDARAASAELAALFRECCSGVVAKPRLLPPEPASPCSGSAGDSAPGWAGLPAPGDGPAGWTIVIDGEQPTRQPDVYRCLRGQEAESGVQRIAGLIMREYREKPGTILDELLANLAFPPVGQSPPEALALAAHAVAERAAAEAARTEFGPLELLVLRTTFRTPIGVDRDLGWVEVPGAGDPHNPTVLSELADCLSGHVHKWVKLVATVAALSAPETPGSGRDRLFRSVGEGRVSSQLVGLHRQLRPGQTIAWPSPCSVCRDQELSDERAFGRSGAAITADMPGTICFRISGVETGTSLDGIADDGGEYILPPLTVLAVEGVSEDPRNQFGEGLVVTLRCLGPLGGALHESPDFDAFLAEVRTDVVLASAHLATLTGIDTAASTPVQQALAGTVSCEGSVAEPDPVAEPAATVSAEDAAAECAARSVHMVAEVVDAEKAARAAESYTFEAEGDVAKQMETFADQLVRWYRAKPGNVLHELCANLRAPPGTNPRRALAVIAHELAARTDLPKRYSDMWPIELLVLRSYTQKPIDVDRDLGWPSVPAPPKKDELAAEASKRAAYEKRFNSWNWEAERDGVPQRNGSLFGPVCGAMRDQGRSEWSGGVLQQWIKWACTVAALSSDDADPLGTELWRGLGGGGVSKEIVDKHRALRPGQLLAWPAKSSTSFDEQASEEYMLGTAANSTGKLSRAKPGSILFCIKNTGTGLPLKPLSQYPAEEELLLGPLTLFEISSVEPDPRNAFGEGLKIGMKCLGPLGRRLGDSPELLCFFAEVREDARNASIELATWCTGPERAPSVEVPQATLIAGPRGAPERGSLVYYREESKTVPARVLGYDLDGSCTLSLFEPVEGGKRLQSLQVSGVHVSQIKRMPCPRSPPRVGQESPRRGRIAG